MDILTTGVPEVPVDSARIRSAIGHGAEERAPRTLRAYWLLQPGHWGIWLSIWLLQNVRFAPIYLLPLMTGKLIDAANKGSAGEAVGMIPLFATATVGLCVFNVLGDTGARLLLSRISRGLTFGLRGSLLHRLNRLKFAFHDRETAGEIEGKFTIDLQRLESFQAFLADGLLMNATVILVMIGIIIATNPLLLGIITVGVALNLVLVTGLWSRLRGAQTAYRMAEGEFLHRLGETIRGLRVTRAHAVEDFAERRLARDARDVARKGVLLDFLINLFGSSSWAISTILTTAVVMLGVCLVVAQPHTWSVLGINIAIRPISIGEFTILLSYYGIVTGAVSSIINHVPSVTGANDAIRSLAQLYREEDEVQRGGRKLETIDGAISLRHVSFAYAGTDRPIIDDLDLDIAAGTSVALVGPSGSGKSTLASLILGFYRPQQGVISVDGVPLVELDLRSLRKRVGLVSQDVVLFNDSILDNIAWGDPEADPVRATEAARLANASEFIDRFPTGIDQVLGDRGNGLSGGQRQRLAIARALYRDPRILVLDEATSALDSESEHQVQQAVEQAMRGRTTIIIAHRLSTVRRVDRIVVLDRGRVVESGTYDELIAKGGLFARMAGGPAGA